MPVRDVEASLRITDYAVFKSLKLVYSSANQLIKSVFGPTVDDYLVL